MTTYILHMTINGNQLATGFASWWLAERASRRALNNGAQTAWIEEIKG
jgi:hypothetical protein